MKYTLTLRGPGFDGSAHKLTDDEVTTLNDYMEDNLLSSPNELYGELPELLEGYSYSDTNWWSDFRPMASENLEFVLTDPKKNIIWKKTLEEMLEPADTEDFPYPDDAIDVSKSLDAVPCDDYPNLLLVYEEIKGTIVSYTIESDTAPKAEEIAYTKQTLETPDSEIDLLDKVFYKGRELEREYDKELWRGKELTIQINTLNN